MERVDEARNWRREASGRFLQEVLEGSRHGLRLAGERDDLISRAAPARARPAVRTEGHMGIEIRSAAVMGQVGATASLLGPLLSDVQAKKAAVHGLKYSYDACGRLAAADTPEGRVSISYDALGQRATVAAGGSARRRACDPLRPYNDAAWIEGSSYMFDSRLAAAVDEDGSVLYVACDELGSPTHVFDEAGALLQSCAYDEFGMQEEPCEGRLVPFGFAGYEIDGTGMLFAQARSYDPPTGRFCSEDVLRGDPARPQTLNRCAYCRGNPVGLVDRDGREAGSGNLLDIWDRFYQDNYGEESADITIPFMGDIIGLYQGGRTVTHHTGGDIFVKTQDKMLVGGFQMPNLDYAGPLTSLSVTDWSAGMAGAYQGMVYWPSPLEFGLALGVVGLGALMVLLGLKYLPLKPAGDAR